MIEFFFKILTVSKKYWLIRMNKKTGKKNLWIKKYIYKDKNIFYFCVCFHKKRMTTLVSNFFLKIIDFKRIDVFLFFAIFFAFFVLFFLNCNFIFVHCFCIVSNVFFANLVIYWIFLCFIRLDFWNFSSFFQGLLNKPSEL